MQNFNNIYFSIKDKDYDYYKENCVVIFNLVGWFSFICFYINLNGEY